MTEIVILSLQRPRRWIFWFRAIWNADLSDCRRECCMQRVPDGSACRWWQIWNHCRDERKARWFYGIMRRRRNARRQIRSLYEDTDYVLDPHTAVAAAVYNKYKEETGDTTKTVIASTASPYKFTRTVMSAMDEKYADMDDFALTEELEKISGVRFRMRSQKSATHRFFITSSAKKMEWNRQWWSSWKNNRMRALRAFQCHKSQRDGW